MIRRRPGCDFSWYHVHSGRGEDNFNARRPVATACMTHANSSRITRFAGKSCEVHGELKVFHEVGRGCRSSWLQVHCFWIVHALAIQSIKLFDHILEQHFKWNLVFHYKHLLSSSCF
ncbi:hypothetical protein Mapa_017444 [Marchantia paleacea]|nr:hypothetical protein Mapa_017444 [Marchantia paleacea]